MSPAIVPIAAAKSHIEAVTADIAAVTAYTHPFEPTATFDEKNGVAIFSIFFGYFSPSSIQSL